MAQLVPSLVYIESVDTESIDDIWSAQTMLQVGERLAAERGTASALIARTDTGDVLTPDGYSDLAFDVSQDGGMCAAARVLEASRWGQPVGADYLTHYWVTARLEDPERFGDLMPAWPLPHIGDVLELAGPQRGTPGPALCDVVDVRVSADGSRTVWLEEFPSSVIGGYGVWVEDRASGVRRLATRLRGATAALGDMSLSPDGRWLLANSPDTYLVDLETGQNARFGGLIRAACWYPFAGPSAVLAALGETDEPSDLRVLDLSDFSHTTVAKAPRRVDGLDAAPDGSIAARVNGGAHLADCVMVSGADGRSFEPVAPLQGASGWQRRTLRPRWVPRVAADVAGPVSLDPAFEEFLRTQPAMQLVSAEEEIDAIEKCLARFGSADRRLWSGAGEIRLFPELRAVMETFAQFDHQQVVRVLDTLATVKGPPVRGLIGQTMPTLMRTAARYDGPVLRALLAEVVLLGKLAEPGTGGRSRLTYARGENQ